MKEEYRTPIRFPRDVWEALKQLAREDTRSFNGEVIWILRDYLKQRKGDKANESQSLQIPPVSQ